MTEDPRRTRRRGCRGSDNFLACRLGVVEPHTAEIERGLGRPIARIIEKGPDDHVGARFEEAFRIHLRRLGAAGALGGEATRPRVVDAPRLSRRLARAAVELPDASDDVRLAIAARETVRDPGDALAITAADLLSPAHAPHPPS